MQIHLDPVGGIAGDMFVAAILNAYPEFEPALLKAIKSLALPSLISCRVQTVKDNVLAGSRFLVEVGPDHKHQHTGNSGGSGHRHRHWSEIRKLIQEADLLPTIKQHAIGIFSLLAEAEARVHGIPAPDVAFHEVGAVDSIVDIVGAAFLIDALRADRWTISPLPLGSGQIESAHGRLPIPAPATALLLEGFAVFDDGVPGERVTPTGAAVVRYLCQQSASRHHTGILERSGFGLGTKSLPGVSNVLRVLALQQKKETLAGHRELFVAEFEVDDQSAEELATGLDRIRNDPAVFDVIQFPAIGKKGRQASHIKVLADPEKQESVIALCFQETTTIGLRFRTTQAIALPRQIESVQVGDRSVRVKIVQRPGIGTTAKAEADDLLLAGEGYKARAELKTKAEEQALSAGLFEPRYNDP
ncbi:MAG TPA: nickel pincer cofactor biosynthesis protein LarC [Chthoniobacterales bacterium]|nr:nickel pincer cofactor biosynthesis protein LarC [Chthoniobacterales bacterium]